MVRLRVGGEVLTNTNGGGTIFEADTNGGGTMFEADTRINEHSMRLSVLRIVIRGSSLIGDHDPKSD